MTKVNYETIMAKIAKRNPKRSQFTLTSLQQEAINRLNKISAKGRRGSGARQAMQRKAVRKWYEKQAIRLGYTLPQTIVQFQDIIDMAFLEATADD